MVTDGIHQTSFDAGGTSIDVFQTLAQASPTTTEANHQAPIPAGMTVDNLHCYVETNDRDSTTNFRLRIAGSNGNLAASITASTTGVFSDTSNNDVLSQGDLVDYMWDFTTGSGNLRVKGAGLVRSA